MNSTNTQNIDNIEIETSDRSKEEWFSELTGFDTDLDESGDLSQDNTTTVKKPVPLLSDEELEQQITKHSFASNPLAKLIFVGGGVFILIFIVSLVFAQFQSSDSTLSGKKETATKEKETNKLISEQKPDSEKGELLSELALKEQRERIKALHIQQLQTGRRPPKTSQVKSTGTPIYKPTPVATSPTPVIKTKPTIASKPQKTVSRISLPVVSSVVSPVASIKQYDTIESWKQLSEVGSFGSGNSQSGVRPASYSSTSNQSRPFYQPVNTTASNVLTPDSTKQYSLVSNDPQAIAFGQLASGTLETTISWEASYNSQNKSDEQYLVSIDQPLKDQSGKVQIPAGSKLIVRQNNRTTALVTLDAESVIINGVTIPLPQGGLKIRTPDGQPLIAQVRTIGGGDNNTSVADVISGLASVANISRWTSF